MPQVISVAHTKQSIIALVLLLLTGCDGGFFMVARVVDSEGRAIPGVNVQASSKKSSSVFDSVSDKDGCLSLGGLIAPGKFQFSVTAQATGYKPLNFSVPTLEQNSFQLVLAKQPQTFNSQAQAVDETQLRRHCGGI
jgi:hypothetical protein